jgi:hypothetical protein
MKTLIFSLLFPIPAGDNPVPVKLPDTRQAYLMRLNEQADSLCAEHLKHGATNSAQFFHVINRIDSMINLMHHAR